ncbi:hypothetical protein LINGRAHAP2_LOCUS10268 [Linum grandiflorum]
MTRTLGLVAIGLVLWASLLLISVPNLMVVEVAGDSPPPPATCLTENFVVQNCGPANCDKKCKKDCLKFKHKENECYGVCATGTFFCNCYGPCSLNPPPSS